MCSRNFPGHIEPEPGSRLDPLASGSAVKAFENAVFFTSSDCTVAPDGQIESGASWPQSNYDRGARARILQGVFQQLAERHRQQFFVDRCRGRFAMPLEANSSARKLSCVPLDNPASQNYEICFVCF